MKEIVAQIEMYLLAAGGFVPTKEICLHFSITKRRLRQSKKRPGLLDGFAVSSTRKGQHGYIHHRHLPTDMWLNIKRRMRNHAVSELRRINAWCKGRRNCLTGKRGDLRERHTGQRVALQ